MQMTKNFGLESHSVIDWLNNERLGWAQRGGMLHAIVLFFGAQNVRSSSGDDFHKFLHFAVDCYGLSDIREGLW